MKIKIICLLIILALVSYGLIRSFNSAIPRTEPLTLTVDHRDAELSDFFSTHKCSQKYITDYINAADKYKLDYRTLPAISVLESECGKHACGDGIRQWGYGSCKGYTFKSVAEGIDFVSNALENGSPYRGKTLIQKLKIYNSVNPNYSNEIFHLMNEMKDIKPYQIKV